MKLQGVMLQFINWLLQTSKYATLYPAYFEVSNHGGYIRS